MTRVGNEPHTHAVRIHPDPVLLPRMNGSLSRSHTSLRLAFFIRHQILEITPHGTQRWFHPAGRAAWRSILWLYHSSICPMLLELWVIFQCFAVTNSASTLSVTASGLGFHIFIIKKLSINFYFECLDKTVLVSSSLGSVPKSATAGHRVNRCVLSLAILTPPSGGGPPSCTPTSNV